MMKFINVLTVFMLISLQTLAQNQEVTLEMLETKRDGMFPEAKAVVLEDYGETDCKLSMDFTHIEFKRKVRIQIFDQSKVELGQVRIAYLNSGHAKEEIRQIEAYSYNIENGKIVKTNIGPKDIYDQKLTEHTSIKRFAIPNVKAGTIIEYSYTFVTSDMFRLPDWDFQREIATRYSKYRLKLTPVYSYEFMLKGASKFTEHKSYKEPSEFTYSTMRYQKVVHDFVMKDLPGVKKDEFISSMEDYIVKLDLQLSSVNYPSGNSEKIIDTWEVFFKSLVSRDDYGKFRKQSKRYAQKEIVEKLNLKGKENIEIVKQVINYVKNRVRWTGKDRLLAKNNFKKFIELNEGNSSEINLFTAGILEAAGITVYPVIASTRDYGKFSFNYPIIQDLNCTILLIKVQGKNFLGDATSKFVKFNELPERYLNGKGVALIGNRADVISFVPKRSSRVIKLYLTPDSLGKIEVKKKVTITGNEAVRKRVEIAEDHESYFTEMNKKNTYTNVKLDSASEISNLQIPFTSYFSFESNADLIDDELFVNPFLEEGIQQQIFPEGRNLPVDLIWSRKRKIQSEIEIPAGYEVVSLPVEEKLKTEYFQYKISSKELEGKVVVVLYYSFKQPVIPVSEYENLRMFYADLMKLSEASVGFKKK